MFKAVEQYGRGAVNQSDDTYNTCETPWGPLTGTFLALCLKDLLELGCFGRIIYLSSGVTTRYGGAGAEPARLLIT